MRRRLRCLLPLLVVALGVSACGAVRPPAAVVEGERITDAQLAHDEVFFTFLASLNRQTCGTPVRGESQQAACARFTLATVIQEDLVKHYAAANHIAVPPSKVTSTIAQLQANLGGASALDERLQASGMTRADLNELASRLLLFDAVQTVLGQAFATWLQGRLASADISVNPKYGRLDTATGEIVPIRSTATGSPAPSLSPATAAPPATSASPAP